MDGGGQCMGILFVVGGAVSSGLSYPVPNCSQVSLSAGMIKSLPVGAHILSATLPACGPACLRPRLPATLPATYKCPLGCLP